MISNDIAALAEYGVKKGLIEEADRVWAINSMLTVLKLDEYDPEAEPADGDLEPVLGRILDDAAGRGIIDGGIVSRDLLDTALMGVLTPRPSAVIAKFEELKSRDVRAATDWYYDFSRNTDYIRTYRVKKDMRWISATEYGDMDITVNLSKPEKDPKAIAAAKLAPQSGYPKCNLCREAEGYAGRINYPARQNHRIIPLKLAGDDYFLQYSPYVYYNEHCIVFNAKHTPMKVDRSTFEHLLAFVEQYPHYFLGSNADLPIVGGSILSHDHFQGGRYTFAMAKAPVETEVTFRGFEDVGCGIVKWPMSVIRISSENRERLIELADRILAAWRGYTDEDAGIFAETGGEKHNTVTPIARMRDGHFELDLVLRNNLTTEEHPLGVFHPHAELHHIKKENIGLIEVMGLAVLPSRLKGELAELERRIIAGESLTDCPETAKHAPWVEELRKKYDFTAENTGEILRYEVGQVFSKVLEHAGVYKRTEEGRAAFLKFIASV